MDDNPAERKDLLTKIKRGRALWKELEEIYEDMKGRLDGADFDEDDDV